MGKQTNISYCQHTFNPHLGCTPIGAGCAHCYARRVWRLLGIDAAGGERRITSDRYWQQPFAWERAAAKAGERRRVLCGSACDVFEAAGAPWGADSLAPEVAEDCKIARCRLERLVWQTPHLDWLWLTKRYRNAGDWGSRRRAVPPNLWIGFSVSTASDMQEAAKDLWRLPSGRRWLSIEPLLQFVGLWQSASRVSPPVCEMVDWVVIGGESGPQARRCDPNWVLSLWGQCQTAGVPCYVKQLGSHWAKRQRNAPVDCGRKGEKALWLAPGFDEDRCYRQYPAAMEVAP